MVTPLLLALTVQFGNVGRAIAQTRDIGSHRQLFIDDWIVTKTVNIRKEQGTVVKHPGNPILVRDRPWDAGRLDMYGSAVYDPVNNRLQIFYSAVSMTDGHDDRLAYAESYDGGQTWTKPNLGLISFGEHEQTNLVLNSISESLAGPSVFRDEHETDPAKRYKLFAGEKYKGSSYNQIGNYYQADPSVPRPEGIGEPGIYVTYSPDGIHWTRPGTGPISNMLSDTGQSAFWDERTGKYVAYVRARVGTVRSVGRMESPDFETWTEPQLVLPGTLARQIYSMGVTPYQGVYIGTPWIFHESATGDQKVIWSELALSRDGLSWSQPFKGQLLVPLGTPNSGDLLQIRMASSLIEMDDKIILIYGQTDQPHVADMQVDIGMATMRLDGFAAMVAGDTEGWILTKLLQAKPGRLMVNTDIAPGGYVKAEILGQNGAVLSGYELDTCTAAAGDSIKTPLVWKTKASVPETDQQPFRIHFMLKNAKLYSFWVEPAPKATEPAVSSGITDVSRGEPALTGPHDDKEGQVLKYGLGQIFQVAPRTAAVSCNIRTVGTGHWDFENGTDIVVFDDLSTIGQQKRIVVARNDKDRNPATGKKRVAVTYPIDIGFVPLGAKRADGSAHPNAGTGFGFSKARCYDLNDEGYYTPADAKVGAQAPSAIRLYIHQFTYDGREFRVMKRETKSVAAPLKTADGAWAITGPGLSTAIADGDDLLLPVAANDGNREAAGVSRWRCQSGDWGPVAFHPVSEGTEPSLVRDIDGSLLYSSRGHGEEGTTVRVWRSGDNGQNWEQVFHDPKLRSNAPVVLNQAADGTPYITGNQPGSFRAKLCLWPLNVQRTGCRPAIMARDCVGDFGPAPEGTLWFADHPMATTVRLADRKWHGLLGYRLMAFSTAGVGGETPTPRTGCYIEEVLSAGPARPTWQF